MRNASATKVKMSDIKHCEQEHIQHFLYKRVVTKKFHVIVVRNKGKEMYIKSVLRVQSCFFAK